MAKVFRGGKWGTVSRSSREGSASSRPPSESPSNLPTDNEEEFELDEVGSIVSFFEERKILGVACYDFVSNEIYISRVKPDDDYFVAAQVIAQTSSHVVVLPSSYGTKDDLLKAIRDSRIKVVRKDESGREPPSSKEIKETSPSGSEVEENPGAKETIISFIPNPEFGVTKSRELCSLIRLKSMPDRLEAQERLTYLSHIIGEEDCMLRSIGGLVSFILRNGILGTVTRDAEPVHINAIVYRNFFEVMKLTPTTLRALRVFSNDMHPVGYGSLRGKEGMSLYGILKTHIKTAAARDLLRSWLRYPSTRLDIIEERQFVVDLLRKNSNGAILVAVKDALRGVKNVPAILRRLQKICAGVNDWKALHSSLKSFIILLDTLKVTVQQNAAISQSPLFGKFVGIEEHSLRDATNWIDAVVDFNESAVSGRMIVVQGFSEEIDDMKRSYSALDDFLTSVGIEEHKTLMAKDNSLSLSSLYFRYHPQVGYLVVLTESDYDRIGIEALESHGLSFIFRSTEREYHFKNERCRELDDELGDIHSVIINMESKAFRYLESKIFSCSAVMYDMFSFVRELDCLQALASSAMEYSWVKPNFSHDVEIITIEEGRHPLLDLLVPSFVPNSTNLCRGDVKVLTGPNYSGKSSYLTQVALIVILGQIGSYVPARSATLVTLDIINSRISHFESVSHAQSSFFTDASKVAQMFHSTPGRALNLIDEFGKGTLEVDGMALLATTLRHFLRMSPNIAPFTLCTTHFVEILSEPILPVSNPKLLLFSMEVMTGPINQGSRAAIPTHGLKDGRLESSPTADPRKGLSAKHQDPDGVPLVDDSLSSGVRTYRLLSGSICQESRALQCAKEAQVPISILRRAAHIRAAVSGSKNIENIIATADRSRRVRNSQNRVRAFLERDEEDDVEM